MKQILVIGFEETCWICHFKGDRHFIFRDTGKKYQISNAQYHIYTVCSDNNCLDKIQDRLKCINLKIVGEINNRSWNIIVKHNHKAWLVSDCLYHIGAAISDGVLKREEVISLMDKFEKEKTIRDVIE